MVNYTLVYWHGIIGIPGKGPNYSEKYNPDRTIGEIIQTMMTYKLGANNKRIEIFKFTPGRLDKYNPNDLYWNHNTKLSEYVNIMGGLPVNDVMLIYVIV